LSFKDIKLILLRLKKLGTIRIGFTGGEPLLHDDIEKILKFAKKLNFFVTLNTNSILLSRYNHIFRYVDIFFISLDGDEAINNKYRNYSARRVIENIKLLLSFNKRIIITTVLTEQDLSDIDFVLNLSKNTIFFVILSFFLCIMHLKIYFRIKGIF